MPDDQVMISALGGMVAFGLNGVVLGPVIAAMFILVWHVDGTTRVDAVPSAAIRRAALIAVRTENKMAPRGQRLGQGIAGAVRRHRARLP